MKNFKMTLILAAMSWLTLGSVTALANTRYVMVVFGYQGTPDLARSSHTFATFARIDDGALTEETTISWLPARGYFGPQYTMPPLATVPGHNYTMDETIYMAGQQAILYWGPFDVTPDLYERARERAWFLAQGTTSYKMFVLREKLRIPALYNRPGGTINCIMGVSDLGGYLDTGNNWGYTASQLVLSHLSRWVYNYPYGIDLEAAALLNLRERVGR